ncbi:MAG: cytochrome c maturation protein CcmE [Porticoccaceae bacterium]|nr:cytochrome c maturation protein CcmE [Porticoccaceae bacterium]
MHLIRRQRLQWVILMLVTSSMAVGLVVYALGQNTNYFYTPSQIAQGVAPIGVRVRAGGMVVVGSLERAADSLDVEFDVSDGAVHLRVHYSGILPDLFDEGQAAIVAGVVDANSVLQATEVLAKHDENYMPPEVADTMSAAYREANGLGGDY